MLLKGFYQSLKNILQCKRLHLVRSIIVVINQNHYAGEKEYSDLKK